MPKTATTKKPAGAKAALFDVTEYDGPLLDEGVIERIPLDDLELADNPRRDISSEGIERLAGMLMRTGQLVPCIAWPNAGRTLIYDGQRRFLAARASADLAGTDGYESLKALRSLVVLLLDHEPAPDEIRRIQAQANQREDLSRRDQQEQFRDCWEARTGLSEDERILCVCEDLGISAKQAHNLRRELTLPEHIRVRVSDRPSGDQLSVGMAKRIADIHDTAPQLAEAVAEQITSRDLHDKAQRDLAGFVHKTVVEKEDVYAVRIELGRLLDGHDEIERARQQLAGDQQRQRLAEAVGCELDKLDTELDTLTRHAKSKALKIRVDEFLRDRATHGRYAYVEHRGEDFAAMVWITDPVFTIGLVAEHAQDADDAPALEEGYFKGAGLDDDDLREAAEVDAARRSHERARQQAGHQANLGLGLDIRARLMDPKDSQLAALQAICCHLLVQHYGEVIAYGAGWTDQERQQPVGDTGRFEPRQIDAIVDAELQRALDDPDPLRGIAQLVARVGAAFMLDPGGVTRTKALGSDRMARRLREAVAGGENPLRTALWEFMRPMLSPHLVDANKDAFVFDAQATSTVDLNAYLQDSSLEDIDLGGDDDLADAA
jgi:ParB-like nuclease domain